MAALRGRLMGYSKGMPGGRLLRAELQQVIAVGDVEAIAERHIGWLEAREAELTASAGPFEMVV